MIAIRSIFEQIKNEQRRRGAGELNVMPQGRKGIDMPTYRIYFTENGIENDNLCNDNVCEVELYRGSKPITPEQGKILRVCDDHGRVVSGEPWPKEPKFISTFGTREPRYHA